MLTVQVLVTVVYPLVMVAITVLAPVLRLEDETFKKVLVPELGVPFTAQLTLQAESLGTTANWVVVAPAAATRTFVVEGEDELKLQTPLTVTDQVQVAVSYPSEISVVIVLVPVSEAVGEKMTWPESAEGELDVKAEPMALPLCFQVKDRGSLFESEPIATSAILPPTAKVLPVDAGV